MSRHKVPIQANIEPELMILVENVCTKVGISLSSYLRSLIQKDLLDRGHLTADKLIEMTA
jgi:hypothetical protein